MNIPSECRFLDRVSQFWASWSNPPLHGVFINPAPLRRSAIVFARPALCSVLGRTPICHCPQAALEFSEHLPMLRGRAESVCCRCCGAIRIKTANNGGLTIYN
jgi:hypothetical protein